MRKSTTHLLVFHLLAIVTVFSYRAAGQSAVIYVDQLPDPDLGGKLIDCVGRLPASGGVCDARALGGSQAINQTVVTHANKPVQLLLGASTITVSASIGFDLGASSSIVGIGPGPGADFTAIIPSTIIKAGASNTVLVRTVIAPDGTLTPGIVLRDLTVDGNKVNFPRGSGTGTIGLQLSGAVRSRLENITVQNCSGEQVQLKFIADTTWVGGTVIGGAGTGIHIMDNGAGTRSGNLQLRGFIIANNGGDGILFEGSGGGQVFSGINFDHNVGAGMRVQAETTGANSGIAPNGFTLDTITFESNGPNVPAQLILHGSNLPNGLIVSVTANQLIFNGFQAPATAVDADWTRSIVFTAPLLFGSTNSFNFTNNSLGNLVIFPRSSDTNFYASGSSGAMIFKPSNAQLTTGNAFPYDSIICDNGGSIPCGVRGGPAPNSSRLFVSDPSFVGSVNLISNSGGASVAINDAASSEFRVVKTSDGINYSVLARVDSAGNQTVNGNMSVIGTLSKGAGSFKIDHPLDPANKYLYHSFVESPDMKNIYDGVVILDEKGEADVTLSDWFEALNENFRYQLSCIGGWAPVYIAHEIERGRFRIAGGKQGMKISWQVTGVRHDAFAVAHRVPVVQAKPATERGHYLYPDLFKHETLPTAASGGH